MNRKTAFLICSTVLISTNISILTRIHADEKQTVNTNKIVDGKEESFTDETIESNTVDTSVICNQNGGTVTINKNTLHKSGDTNNEDGKNAVVFTTGSSFTKIDQSDLQSTSKGSSGIVANEKAMVYANDSSIMTSNDSANGLEAYSNGQIIANKMDITTQGNQSAAVYAKQSDGSISLTNSTLSTDGNNAPLLYANGTIEVDNVSGTASHSKIAEVEGGQHLSIYNSQFSSTNNSLLQNETMKNGIGMNRSDDGNDCSRIDICNSILSTMIDDGSMFYIDGQDANIVLNKSLLSFDCDHVDLLHVSNGNVKLTGSEETMVGNITAADHARADVYLLDGSSYTGSTSYENQGTLNMNISSDSSWIVSSDSKVNCLNIESGGEIIDEDGNLVTITQQGKTIISGTSPYSVTVDEKVGSSFDTNSDNALCTSYMDRTNFDHTYQVSTAFSTNTASLQAEEDTNDGTVQDNSMKYVLVTLATIGVISFVSYIICKKNKQADM